MQNSQSQNSQFKHFVKEGKPFQGATKLPHNVGSYTQGRIAGDFLSSRKTARARAERCTPKTTAAELAG